jgi:hypothetical protein
VLRSITLRQHRTCRAVTAGAAILVQLHLFFILQLHGHGSLTLLETYSISRRARHAQVEALEKPEPFCPACQIARHGSVYPAPSAVGPDLLPFVPGLVLLPAVLPTLNSRLPVGARDPPAD